MAVTLELPTALEFLRRGFDWLLPPMCLGCRRSPGEGIDRLNLCGDCRARVRPLLGRRCPGCLAPIIDSSAGDGFPCGDCRRNPPPFGRLYAGWLYEPPIEQVVVGLKFQRLEYLADALAAELLTRYRPQLARVTGVVAVPLHWRRALSRGYNQAELLARALANGLDRPLIRALSRPRPTAAQTGLDRAARKSNLRHAFAWRGAAADAAAHWLLVDDVCTTAATLESAARELVRGGVGRVDAMVAALTPKPHEREDRNSR